MNSVKHDEPKPQVAQTEPSNSQKRILILVVSLIFLAFLFFDFLTPPAFESRSPFMLVLMMNLVVGQLTLLCVWGTMVEGTFWIRLPWTILMLVVSWAAIASGIYFAKGSVSNAQVLGLGLVWFFAFAVSYIPLKFAAWSFGWRIGREDSPKVLDSKRSYQIRDMMIGTAILAVTLAIGRLLIQGDLPTWTRVIEESGLDHSTPIIGLSVFSIVSLIVKLPCIWIALAVPMDRIKSLSFFWIAISSGLGLVEMGILVMFLGSPGPDFMEYILGLMIGHAAMASIMIGVLYLMRSFGYEITRYRKALGRS